MVVVSHTVLNYDVLFLTKSSLESKCTCSVNVADEHESRLLDLVTTMCGKWSVFGEYVLGMWSVCGQSMVSKRSVCVL